MILEYIKVYYHLIVRWSENTKYYGFSVPYHTELTEIAQIVLKIYSSSPEEWYNMDSTFPSSDKW